MKNHSLIASAFLLIFGFAYEAKAFRLEPMVANFAPSGDGATKIFRIENEAKEKIAVKLEAFTREIDDKGKEKLTPSKDFKIYPEQMSLNGSDSRAVRVVYLGPKDMEQETAYRIVASQLPVSFKEDKKQTGIKFLFQFVASVYVTNENYYPKIVVENTKRLDKDTLRVSIANKGQRHVVLKNVKLELKDNAGKNVAIDESLIKGWDGENLLSGHRRVFKVKTTSDFDLAKNVPKVEIKDENISP
jgi:fimbrial chaperone protein